VTPKPPSDDPITPTSPVTPSRHPSFPPIHDAFASIDSPEKAYLLGCLAADLIALGITPRKTFTLALQWGAVPDPLHGAIVAGLIDGDGALDFKPKAHRSRIAIVTASAALKDQLLERFPFFKLVEAPPPPPGRPASTASSWIGLELVEGVPDVSVLVDGVLQLDDRDGQPVDEDDHIGAPGLPRTLHPERVDHQPVVRAGVSETPGPRTSPKWLAPPCPRR
jgi:hypothetical protein